MFSLPAVLFNLLCTMKTFTGMVDACELFLSILSADKSNESYAVFTNISA